MTQPTGVFVRLPLSEDDCALLIDASSFGAPDDSHDKALLAIGTPVTGGELDVVGTIHIGDNGKPFFTAPEIHSTGGDVVRQSDALAKLTEKDAEILRLRAALDDIEMSIDALPDELECGDRMTAREMQRQALIIVKEEMKALKGPEA